MRVRTTQHTHIADVHYLVRYPDGETVWLQATTDDEARAGLVKVRAFRDDPGLELLRLDPVPSRDHLRLVPPPKEKA